MSIDVLWAVCGLVNGGSLVTLGARLSGPESVVLPRGWRGSPTRENFTVGLVFGACIAVLAYRFAGSVALVAWVWFAVTGVPLMLIDWICHRLPDRLVGAMLFGGIVNFSCFSVAQGGMTSLFRALGAAGVVYCGALVTAIAAPGSLGGGDVKLLGTVALYLGWAGWAHVVRGIVFAVAFAAVVGAFLIVTRRLAWRGHLAFGPAVIGGAFIALVLP